MHKVTVDDAGSTVKGCSLGQAERAGRGIAHGKCAALKRGLVLSKGCSDKQKVSVTFSYLGASGSAGCSAQQGSGPQKLGRRWHVLLRQELI